MNVLIEPIRVHVASAHLQLRPRALHLVKMLLDCFCVALILVFTLSRIVEKLMKGSDYLTIIRAFRVLRPLRAINKVPSKTCSRLN